MSDLTKKVVRTDKSKQKEEDSLQEFLLTIKTFVDSHEDIETILSASQAWADSDNEKREKAKNWAIKIAIGCSVFAFGSLFLAYSAIQTAMVPAPPPQVLVLDKATNLISPLMSLDEVKVKFEDALLRRALNTFMICRERYIADMAESDYFCAASFMSSQLQTQWAQFWDTENPNGPIAVYGKEATVKPEIVSIQPRENLQGIVDTAQVFFSRKVTRNGVPTVTQWVADVSFKMVNLPKEEGQRRINDIGLQITQYSTNEVLGGYSQPKPQSQPVNPPSNRTGGLSAPAFSPNQGR